MKKIRTNNNSKKNISNQTVPVDQNLKKMTKVFKKKIAVILEKILIKTLVLHLNQ